MKKNMQNKPLKIIFMITIIFIFIVGCTNSKDDKSKSKEFVEVFITDYYEVDKIVIIKDENRNEITGSNLDKYKNALEPKNIVSKKVGKEITEKLENKIVEIEYYKAGDLLETELIKETKLDIEELNKAIK